MTYSVLGIDTNEVKEIDPRTGKEKVFYLLKTHQQTGKEELIYLPKSSRLQGLYIIGIQGTGKSVFEENLVIQDILQLIGVCVLDPHGGLIDKILARIPREREKDVVLLDIMDEDYPFGVNLFTCSNPNSAKAVQEVVDQVMHVFEKIFGVGQDTPMILEYLYNCTATLVANPGYTMADIPLLLTDEQCRRKLVANVTDMDVLGFWRQHDQKKPGDQYNDLSSTLRRVRQFLQPLSRPIVGQSTSTIDLQSIMNEGKILLIKLSTRLPSITSLIGSVMIALFLNAAYNRPVNKRRQFHLYADEFQRFATEDFATLLEEARKFGIATTIAHQNRGQLDTKNSQLETNLKDRTRSVANLAMFKINGKDADDLVAEFDCTPIRTKRVLKRRTKPIFKEWDETVWIENGEALYKEAEAQYEAQYDAQRNELTQRLALAEKQEQEALVLRDGAIEAETILSGAAMGDDWDMPPRAKSSSPHFEWQYMPFHPAWYCYRDNWSGIITARSYWAQPGIEFPKLSKIKDWTDEKVEKTIEGLIEVKSKSIADSFEYIYGPMNAGYTDERKLRKKRVDYTYIEREERYALSETTLTGLQIDLQRSMATASTEARRIISDLYDELSEFVKPLLRKGVWFKPELKPSIPHKDFNTGAWGLYNCGPPSYPPIWKRGREFEEGLLEWPLLAKHPQPQSGEKRTVRGWVHHGEWSMWGLPRAIDRLDKRKKALQTLCEQRKDELRRCREHVSTIKQQLNEFKAKDQHIRPEIKAQYQKLEHHKEYLGEQPEVDMQERISHSYSQGSSQTTGISRMGESASHGTSSSKSTSYSTSDVQWYDLVDELDQTPAERQDELANELANLPNYTAHIKIAVEGKPVEYTIRTLEPERGLRGGALHERIERIQAHNRDEGFTRSRQEVEKEISLRQELLREKPEEPPDAIYRRQQH